MENGHLQWIFPLKMVIFHCYVAVHQRVTLIKFDDFPSDHPVSQFMDFPASLGLIGFPTLGDQNPMNLGSIW